MKMFLISDNIDTYTGMRLAGVEGVVVHEREELKKALDTGVWAAVVGSAITRPREITKKYAEVIK